MTSPAIAKTLGINQAVHGVALKDSTDFRVMYLPKSDEGKLLHDYG